MIKFLYTFHLKYFSDDEILKEERDIQLQHLGRELRKYLVEDKENREGYVDVYEHRKDCRDEACLGRRYLESLKWHDEHPGFVV